MIPAARAAEIIKIAAEKKFTTRVDDAVAGVQGRVQPYTDTAFHKLPAHLAGAPFRFVGDMASSFLFGPKAIGGPMRGKRLNAVRGGPGVGLDEISQEEYEAIRSGKKPGKAVPGTVDGKPTFYSRRYRPGGAVGWVRANPLKATAGALAAYYLAGHRDKIGPSYELGKAFVPLGAAPTRNISQATTDVFSQQSNTNSPFTTNTWG